MAVEVGLIKPRGEGLQDWVMESDGVNVQPLYFLTGTKDIWSAVGDSFGDGMVFECRESYGDADWKADMRA